MGDGKPFPLVELGGVVGSVGIEVGSTGGDVLPLPAEGDVLPLPDTGGGGLPPLSVPGLIEGVGQLMYS